MLSCSVRLTPSETSGNASVIILILNPAVGRSFSSFAMMIYKALLGIDLHIYNEFATRRIAHFLRRMAALQLLGMGRPGSLPEGPREAGIGQRRGCRGRAYGALGCPPPAPGSHLPAEGTAPPCAAAPFRVVASCPAPQKLHTPPRPTAGFRMTVPVL
jgi:hypothetical protein